LSSTHVRQLGGSDDSRRQAGRVNSEAGPPTFETDLSNTGPNSPPDTFGRLLDFLNRLDKERIHYELGHFRPDSILVAVAVPASRWEVEFMADGTLDIERFDSIDDVQSDEALIERLFEQGK
jgi:hypothetical protein